MVSFVKRVLNIRIIRYGLVGGIGIPINDGALFLFLSLLGQPLYPLANACAFLLSNLINFFLNQFFTYREQLQHIHGWEWGKRFVKGQMTSLSASLLAYLVALALVHFLHVNDYVANPLGIVVAFIYNFFISKKLVFRAVAQRSSEAQVTPVGDADAGTEVEAPAELTRVETTPK